MFRLWTWKIQKFEYLSFISSCENKTPEMDCISIINQLIETLVIEETKHLFGHNMNLFLFRGLLITDNQ